jgi:hypothetical protein
MRLALLDHIQNNIEVKHHLHRCLLSR